MRPRREQTMQERFLREPGAVHPDRKRRRWVPRWLVFGLLRLCLWVLLISAVAIGLGLLVGHIRGTDPSRSIPLSLYIAGTAVMLVTFGGALSGRNLYRVAWDESTANDEIARRVQAGRGVYAIVGALVIGLGILFDWLL